MISFHEDDYIRFLQEDRATAIWVATLTDGRRVWMDDHRPGLEPYSAWIRLREFLQETSLGIRGFRLKFRSHEICPASDGADGYFFSKSSVRVAGGKTRQFYLFGHLFGDRIQVQRWKVPELILVDLDARLPERAGECVLLNPAVKMPVLP